MDRFSNAQIDDAGAVLRDWVSGRVEGDIDDEPLDVAVRLLNNYRQGFTGPSKAVEASLATLLADVSSDAKLTGRPKRVGAIVRKLIRYPSMRLTQMADIAGLRVRFSEVASEVPVLCQRMEALWPTAKFIDYVAKPKPTGYRAIHVLVETAGRTVEIQLRTAR